MQTFHISVTYYQKATALRSSSTSSGLWMSQHMSVRQLRASVQSCDRNILRRYRTRHRYKYLLRWAFLCACIHSTWFTAYESYITVCKHIETRGRSSPTNTRRGQEGRKRKQSNLISLVPCLTVTACRLAALHTGNNRVVVSLCSLKQEGDAICMEAS